MAPQPKPYTISWPLSGSQVESIDSMFEILFKALRSGVILSDVSQITGGEALSKVDDTNVTLTLGGTPLTSLLAATSLTLGWTGTLGITRGGTGNATGASTLSAITDDTTTNATMFPTWVTTASGNQALKVSSTKFAFNPSSGLSIADRLTSSSVNGATQVVWVKQDPTISGTIGTAAGNIGGYTFGMMYQPVRFTNGPGGSVNYIDDTWHIGINLGTLSGGIGRADITKPNLAISFESKYYEGSIFAEEWHVQGVSADGLTSFRPLSGSFAVDASEIDITFAVDVLRFNNKAGTGLVQISNTSSAMDVAGIPIRFTTNNVAAIQQKNSSSSYVNLLYLSSGNITQIETPLNVVAARQSTSFATIQPTTANSNDVMLRMPGPSVTGNLNGIFATSSVTGLFQQEFNNQGAGDSQVLVDVEGAGDPKVKFNVNGGGRFTLGIDNSDSDKFKISTGSALGSSDVIILDSSGRLSVGVGTPTAFLHLLAGTATANTAPLKFNSGTVLTSAEAGAIEFTTDDFFATITTGAARKAFILDDGARLSSGKVPVASTNGRLIDGPTLTTVPVAKASGRSTAQTAAVASVATFTVGAADASFKVSGNVNVTTAVLNSFSVTCAYTDETNTAQTLTMPFVQLGGITLVGTITNTTGTGPYEGVPLHIRAKAATAITIATSGTFTSVTYNVEGFITQIG